MLLLGTHPLGGYDQGWPPAYYLYYGGVADPLQTRPSPHVFGRSRSNRMGVGRALMEIVGKNGFLAYRLSRSLKVIGTDKDRSATMTDPGSIVLWISVTGFRDKRRFRSKAQIFPTSVYLTPPLSVPLGIL